MATLFGNYELNVCLQIIMVTWRISMTFLDALGAFGAEDVAKMRNIKKLVYCVVALLAASILAPDFLFGQSQLPVAYPDGYRGWERVKSMVILEGHEHFEAFGGFHHIYANEQAVVALKDQVAFADGAVLVFELFETITVNNAIVEGQRLVIGVMEKDSERFSASENWGFEDFKEANPRLRMVTDMREQCLSCHATQKANDFVYTTYHR
ncbi:MAG: cytochrome P460 family protein [Gammaproteobacteria bacterium]|nr:cytochrome P460 family protein [Gammaproteobacteria bacterium]MDH3750285.1 cytochrome P460 family protein [Gammaproteobacteria bacterium]MDH3805167.1 cytochrome P460 family protein [Gammaproteobacteria bacterium]